MSWLSMQCMCHGQLVGVAGSEVRPLKSSVGSGAVPCGWHTFVQECFWNRFLLPVVSFLSTTAPHLPSGTDTSFCDGIIDFVCCCCDFILYHQIQSSPTATTHPKGTSLFWTPPQPCRRRVPIFCSLARE